MKKKPVVQATEKLVRFSKRVGIVFDAKIGKAAGLSLGDDVRLTVERHRLVLQRARGASSAEEIALGLLGPYGISLSALSVTVRSQFPHTTWFAVRRELDALVLAGRARVEKKDVYIGRKRYVSYHWYPV